MRGHLNDSEMTAYIEGSLEDEALGHLASCAACREEAARLQADLVGLAAHLQGEADRSDAFFQAQRARIASRLEERARRVRLWWRAWAPALAVAALLAGILLRGNPQVDRAPDAEADQAFLSTVHQFIYAEVPGALRPAALLIAEVERSLP
jgi:anti-sigma factor RsiW